MSQLTSKFRHVFVRIQNPLQRLEALRLLLETERSRIRADFDSGESAVSTTAETADMVDALLRSQL